MAWVFVEIDDPLLFQTTRYAPYSCGHTQINAVKMDIIKTIPRIVSDTKITAVKDA